MARLALVFCLLVASSALAEDDRVWTPAYFPRYATLGLESSINEGGTISPVVKVGWAPTLIDQRTNLVFLVELGAAYSIELPPGATDLYQYSLMLGIGLRPKHDRIFQWGFSVLVGGMVYGAHFPGGYDENWTDGLVEGRLSLGYNFGPLTVSGFFGVTQIWYVNIRKLASSLAGGWNVGVVVDWR